MNAIEEISWLVSRFTICMIGNAEKSDKSMQEEIGHLTNLLIWLKHDHSPEFMFNPVFSEQEIDFFKKVYTPGTYGMLGQDYLICSRELNLKYRQLHDNISSLLHAE